MSDAAALSRASLHNRAPANLSSVEGPILLVVGQHDLNRLAMDFMASRAGGRTICGARADVVNILCTTAVDLILLDVDASLMAGFVLAAHLRAADRERDDGRCAAIVATTYSQSRFRECLGGASAIEGALKMPCDSTLFADFVDTWCRVHDFRPGRCEETVGDCKY